MSFNPLQYYEFGKSRGVTYVNNTFIGGVSSTINTASLLAAKLAYYPSGLAFDVADIHNFTIVGNDIECYIGVNYNMLFQAFSVSNGFPNIMTYYRDFDNHCKILNGGCFEGQNFITDLKIEGVTSSINLYNFNSLFLLKEIYLPLCTNIIELDFYDCRSLEVAYLPLCTSYGGTVAYNNVFLLCKQGLKVYAEPTMETINGGGVEGDLDYVTSTLGGSVSYVTDLTSPNTITDLAVNTVYETALKLQWTEPTSTNGIDFYEIYVDGVFNNTSKELTGYAVGLTNSTTYNLTVISVDNFYNKSLVSNNVTQQINGALDVDAQSFITNANITDQTQISSIEILVDNLKTDLLWTKMNAIYPFIGGTAFSHKYNLKDPRDLDVAFRLQFNGTLTHSASGILPNGSNGYANTFFDGNDSGLHNHHISIYIPNNTTSNGGVEIGARQETPNLQFTQLNVKFTDNNFYGASQSTVSVFIPYLNVNSQGFYTTSRLVSTQTVNYKNGAKIQTLLNNSTETIGNDIYIGARNENGSPSLFSNREFSFATCGKGLTDLEATNLYNTIQTYQTILSRNI